MASLVEKEESWKPFEATVESMARLLEHPVIRKCLYVQLTGGEPLLCKELPQIIALVRREGHMAGMTTNGILLGQAIDELKASGINSISVSTYTSNLKRLYKILPKVNTRFRVRNCKIILKKDLDSSPESIEEAIRLGKETGCLGTVLTLYLPGEESRLNRSFSKTIQYSGSSNVTSRGSSRGTLFRGPPPPSGKPSFGANGAVRFGTSFYATSRVISDFVVRITRTPAGSSATSSKVIPQHRSTHLPR